MENKYYTPQIQEFHVGFEYESFERPLTPSFAFESEPPEWTKRKVLDINNSEYKGRALYHVSINNRYEENAEWNKNIRVKYLDKEDIKSFGCIREFSTFSEVLKNPAEVYINEEKNIMLVHYPDINKITIATRDYAKNELTLKSNWDDRQVNLISIKNKNELQRLLKQLTIID